MPFFSQNTWVANASRFWLWVVLTVPSTMLAFAFFTYWKRRDMKRKQEANDDLEMELAPVPCTGGNSQTA